jgi:hypothetical protein
VLVSLVALAVWVAFAAVFDESEELPAAIAASSDALYFGVLTYP